MEKMEFLKENKLMEQVEKISESEFPPKSSGNFKHISRISMKENAKECAF